MLERLAGSRYGYSGQLTIPKVKGQHLQLHADSDYAAMSFRGHAAGCSGMIPPS
jgi:hypothetical protein